LAETFLARARSMTERSERAEANLVEEFEMAATPLAQKVGELLILDAADERITLERDGHLAAEVVTNDDEGIWRKLRTAEDVVEFYEPAELFGHVVDELQAAFPATGEDGLAGVTRRLRALALTFRDRSLESEGALFAQFERAAGPITPELGDILIEDEPDGRLTLTANGRLRAEVLDRATGAPVVSSVWPLPTEAPSVLSGGRWSALTTPDELAESYDPTDVFVDLAELLEEMVPEIGERSGW
jgi:hypothetical protein